MHETKLDSLGRVIHPRTPEWRAKIGLANGKKKGTMWDGLDRSAIQNFKGCHDRVRNGKAPSIEWPRTRNGYCAFLFEIGPKPQDGKVWSVGRKDHKKGYETNNVQWELHIHNSVKRKGTKFENCSDPEVQLHKKKFEKGTEEHIEHQRKASQKRWQDPIQREKIKSALRDWHGRYKRRES